ncbi:hypothetical protein FKP32DRAFT_1589811 [Trametes sanguinea]|nr:hypothetical protein FKP32DRAFT_1589811 [Trametes sanguinea]
MSYGGRQFPPPADIGHTRVTGIESGEVTESERTVPPPGQTGSYSGPLGLTHPTPARIRLR